MRDAIKLNVFDTDNFIWVDFGIRHVFKCSDNEFIQKIESLNTKIYDSVRIGTIWDLNYLYNINIYKDISWYFAGGVFGGDKESLLEPLVFRFDRPFILIVTSKDNAHVIFFAKISNPGVM